MYMCVVHCPYCIMGVDEFLLPYFHLIFESMMLWVWKDITHPEEGRSGLQVKGLVGPIP